ncbi:MAG: hypothetical protein RBR26_10185 [Methanosarcina mazei]|nr:hypothetical protein [Methanosarcina mazei]
MSSVASRITITDTILLYFDRYSSKAPNVYDVPFGTTQDGMASIVGISRAHASLELKKLIENGQVDFIHAHTPKSPTKRKTYFLESSGLVLVPQIRERLKKDNIPEGSLFLDEFASKELRRDPWKVKAKIEIEKAAEYLEQGQNSLAILHLSTAVRELALAKEGLR